ncbi:aminomethyl-transferring glycine dehydrogenase subunit GcvPA [Mycolicibacterium sp.]|uniref:aminomethyl-transferring glycine dehydrogenase subunit GcvPA n=1 Tax=Mycolicibacterium sp. TaxID=2320850 RepID=UPI003D0E8736
MSRAHPYMPNSTAEAQAKMLAAVGVDNVEALFEQIPADHLMTRPLNLPAGIRAEATLDRRMRTLLRENRSTADTISFLGAGLWQHYVPAVCDEIAGRSEFLTPVWGTPSSDLGRNQAWFEYASQLGELVGMEFVGLPVCSWGAAAGYALRMAARMTGRNEVVLAGPMDPERLAVIRTLCGPPEMERSLRPRVVGYDASTGHVDLDALAASIGPTTAAVYFENPNFLGVLESEANEIATLARAAGAETIVGVDPISLGLLAPPSQYGADITVGSTQPLGVHLNAGGGVSGFIATRDEEAYARQYPTLQVSLTDTTRAGQRSFGMTLFEQTSYGCREHGNDWTGNSTYLWAVVNAVYMSLMGPQGFAEIGATISANSSWAAKQIAAVDGVSVRWSSFFKEFVVDFAGTGRTVADINASLRSVNIFGGKDLSMDFPELGQSALYCVTEVHTADDITLLTDALQEAIA